MDKKDIFVTINVALEKELDSRDKLVKSFEKSLLAIYKRQFKMKTGKAKIDLDKEEVFITVNRLVVEDLAVTNEVTQVSYSDALVEDDSINVGDILPTISEDVIDLMVKDETFEADLKKYLDKNLDDSVKHDVIKIIDGFITQRQIVSVVAVIAEEKKIDIDIIVDAMEQAFLSAYKKNYKDTNARVEIDIEVGTIKVFSQTEIVSDDAEEFNPKTQLYITDAKKLDKKYKVGDIIEKEVDFENFGRVAAQTAKQVAIQKIREAERKSIFEEFSELEGDMVVGTLSREDNKNYYIDLGRSHAILPKSEIIPGEKLEMGSKIEVYLSKVEHNSKFPLLLATRKSNDILIKIMENEIPEIKEGIVEVFNAVRDPGDRSKVAVFSLDESIDALGACIGARGSRIQNVINSLNGEKLDIVLYNSDPAVFIENAISPAKVITVSIADPKEKKAIVIVMEDQLSLAIGKKGQNARLAAKLTGWKIDIKSLAQAQDDGVF